MIWFSDDGRDTGADWVWMISPAPTTHGLSRPPTSSAAFTVAGTPALTHDVVDDAGLEPGQRDGHRVGAGLSAGTVKLP